LAQQERAISGRNLYQQFPLSSFGYRYLTVISVCETAGLMCNRLGRPDRTFPERTYAPERFFRIELDGKSNQQVNRGHKFEVLLGAHEPASYQNHGSLCPNHSMAISLRTRERSECAPNKKSSCTRVCQAVNSRDVQPPNWLNHFQGSCSAGLMSAVAFSSRTSHLMLSAIARKPAICPSSCRYGSVSD
jgi:hypothetical protein